MAITARRLIQSAQIEPADLGGDIIDPQLPTDEQQAALEAWVEENVLEFALGEVETPLQKTCGHTDIEGFVQTRFSELTLAESESAMRAGTRLFDAAVMAYARSELNKTVDSSAEEYDKDAAEDRITGNQRLQKLLDWAAEMVKTGGRPGQAPEPTGSSTNTSPPRTSMSVRARPVW